VIDFYHNEGLLKSIDGDRPMEDVTAALKACVSV
jgi:adenylate kinase family enzyme